MFKKTGILKYGIKKLTVGIASVTIGAIIFLGSNAQASDNEIKETVNPVSVEKVDSTLAPKENKKENTEVVLTILPYRKLPDLKDKIKEIDDKAFIIVSHVEEVSGNGFTYTKEMREA